MTDSTTSELEVWEQFFTVPQEKILYMDDDIVVFPDRTPRAATHILVVPRRRYIKGVENLLPTDLQLLQTMARIGAQIANCETVHLGFHRWPLRSVNHLHLHCLVPPYKPAWQKFRYSELFGKSSIFGFISLTSILLRLHRSR